MTDRPIDRDPEPNGILGGSMDLGGLMNGREKPINLGPVDPFADRDALESFVRRVRTAATPELLRRQSSIGLRDVILVWRRWILAGTGLVALGAVAVLVTVKPPTTSTQGTLAEALGVPSAWATWTNRADTPTPGEILEAEAAR